MLAAGLLMASALAARADFTVAVNGPVTGGEATFGEQFKRGAEMAVADINAKGGVLGRKLKLSIGDDACDPKQAVAVANKAVSDKATVVIGHFCSSSSIPSSDVYNEAGIVQISPASTNPALTEKGHWNVFRTCGRDDQQGTVAGNLIADKFKGKNVAILHDKTAYGKGLADETKKQLNKRGVTEAMLEAYNKGNKDFKALVSKMQGAKIDVVYVGGYHQEAGLIIRQAHDQGYKPQLISGDALVTDEYWKITGPAGEGTLMTFDADPRRIKENASLVDRFKKAGYEPEGYTLYTYAAIQAWANAATVAKTTDGKKVAEALKANKHPTVLGNIGFDRKGDVTGSDYVVYVWKNGKYDYLN
jgi:branched-chain amino acid transport system substrate-binding protein